MSQCNAHPDAQLCAASPVTSYLLYLMVYRQRPAAAGSMEPLTRSLARPEGKDDGDPSVHRRYISRAAPAQWHGMACSRRPALTSPALPLATTTTTTTSKADAQDSVGGHRRSHELACDKIEHDAAVQPKRADAPGRTTQSCPARSECAHSAKRKDFVIRRGGSATLCMWWVGPTS